MDRTVAAGCLVFLERTVSEPETGIFGKLATFVTEFPLCMVMVPAIETDHIFYGLLLSFHAGMHAMPSLRLKRDSNKIIPLFAHPDR
jgi:hypothetical protein